MTLWSGGRQWVSRDDGNKRVGRSSQRLFIYKQIVNTQASWTEASGLARGLPISWILELGSLSFIAFGKPLDWSRLMLMLGSYFLLDSSPRLLIGKETAFILAEHQQQIKHFASSGSCQALSI